MVAYTADMLSSSLNPSVDSIPSRKHGRKINLGKDFVPGKFAVLCGRGSKCTKSSGNQRLKQLVHSYLKPYSDAKNKVEKTSIVSAIISSVKQASPDGAFIKYEEGSWWEVEDAFAREKIGCLFRDCLHTQYKSSTKAKLARKKAMTEPFPLNDNMGMHTGMLNGNIPSSLQFNAFPGMDNQNMQNCMNMNSNSNNFMPQLSGNGMFQNQGMMPFQDMSSQNEPQEQCYHAPLSLPKDSGFKKTEYSALLGNYLGMQGARPHRQDFMSECISSAQSMLPMGNDRPASYGLLGEGGRRPNGGASLLREACNILGEDNVNGMNQQSEEEFPDDISGIFEEDQMNYNRFEPAFAF